jgi:hypothetical protein
MKNQHFGNPTASDIHVDQALSEFAIAYRNKQFIADQVFPLVEVDKQSDKYYVWDKGSWLTNQVELRTPGDTYPEGRMKLSTDEYYADIYHLGYPIPWELKKNQDAAVQLEQSGADWLAHQFSLNREVQIAAAIFTTGVWDTNPTVGSDFVAWDDYDNSDPPEDIDTYRDTVLQNTGVLPNTLVIGKQVFSKLRRHPILLDMYKYTGRGILKPAEVAEALDVEKLLIGECVQRTSLEGASSATQAFVWGKNALLLYVPERPAIREPAAGYTFAWKIDDTGLTVNIIPTVQEDRDRDFLKGKHAFDFKVTGSDLGVYFASVIS